MRLDMYGRKGWDASGREEEHGKITAKVARICKARKRCQAHLEHRNTERAVKGRETSALLVLVKTGFKLRLHRRPFLVKNAEIYCVADTARPGNQMPPESALFFCPQAQNRIA